MNDSEILGLGAVIFSQCSRIILQNPTECLPKNVGIPLCMASVKIYGLTVSVPSNRSFPDLFALEVVSASLVHGVVPLTWGGIKAANIRKLLLLLPHPLLSLPTPCKQPFKLLAAPLDSPVSPVGMWHKDVQVQILGFPRELPALIIRLSQRSSHYSSWQSPANPKKEPNRQLLLTAFEGIWLSYWLFSLMSLITSPSN